jgi:phosphoribosyl 1,2-cyclic phosphodiesterase
MQDHLAIRFWGVRGSIPCPGMNTVRYGGNTPCVEVLIGKERLIFDGGTGLRVLGQHLLPSMPLEAHLFFSHTHWDHIQGFPFFEPAFSPGNHFHIYGGKSKGAKNAEGHNIEGHNIRRRLSDQMLHPNFPVPLKIMQGGLTFRDLGPKETLTLADDIQVVNAPLNHPGGGVGYRVNWRGLTVSYISDTEHFPDRLDENVLFLAHQADVMIYDATYTDAEYHSVKGSKVGWGHSTWQEAVKVAIAAGVKQLVLFHHEPIHTDDFLDQIGLEVSQVFPQSVIAKEGLVIELTPPAASIPASKSKRYQRAGCVRM